MPLRFTVLILSILILSGCATTTTRQVETPLEALEALLERQSQGDQEELFRLLYSARTWVPHHLLSTDPIKLSKRAAAPVNRARAKVVGPSYLDAVRSLAIKLWMIEHAQHSLDLTYYIFKYDRAGYAILGALCNAVKRGVDVRIMVDSLGSLSMTHDAIRALETCADGAGFIHDQMGNETPHRARVQFVIINAMTSLASWSNRRSHDKLIIADGGLPGKDLIMTGGRNISLDYYGLTKDGERDHDTFLDLEILLRTPEHKGEDRQSLTVGDVSNIYYTLLSLHRGNRRIYPVRDDEEDSLYNTADKYAYEREKAQHALEFIKSVPDIKAAYADMHDYLTTGFHLTDVRLAHELGNLISQNVVSDIKEIKSTNTNSIGSLLLNIAAEAEEAGLVNATFRIVSPYLFIAQYRNEDGKLIFDGAKEMHDALERHPGLSFEIITNSVLTSDNFYTQSVIDMDTAPRLLLTPELNKRWLKSRRDSELSPEFVNSDEWKRLIANPRIKIYQTGKEDSVLLGGDRHYGKLHAKFFFDDQFGFVGTSNFDYRSRLYNNEMGFFYHNPALSADLNTIFDELRSISYRWGSPEWLQMRRKLIETDSFKGYTTATQRGRYRFLKGTGLIWLF